MRLVYQRERVCERERSREKDRITQHMPLTSPSSELAQIFRMRSTGYERTIIRAREPPRFPPPSSPGSDDRDGLGFVFEISYSIGHTSIAKVRRGELGENSTMTRGAAIHYLPLLRRRVDAFPVDVCQESTNKATLIASKLGAVHAFPIPTSALNH